MSAKYKKCYFGCEMEGVLHRFPNPLHNEERFNLWLLALDSNMRNRDTQYIYNNLRLCDNHFERCYQTASKKLTRNAVPTLNIGSPETISLFQTEVRNITVHPQLDIEVPSTSTGQLSQLNANKRQMQKKICKLQAKLKSLSKRCATKNKKIKCAKNISQTRTFLNMIEKFPEPIKIFEKLQLKHKYQPRGRRYTNEEKAMALTIFKQSAKAYNVLNRMFILPSKRCLQKHLSIIPLDTGVNNEIFSHMTRIVKKLPSEKKLCTLIFDEISLEPGLHFNQGKIIGFETFGNQIADHSLVFMIKSIKGKYKQPICFTFCKSCTKKEDLKNLVKEIISKVHDTGLRIIATVCDQAQTNVAVIKSLKEDTRIKYLRKGMEYKSCAFEIGDDKIFPLFDTPHLLKGVRNNLLKKDAKFLVDGVEKLAKWEHIKMLFNVDEGDDEIKLVSKLTQCHVYEHKMPKMKVKYAAQVFSQRVSSAIGFLARHKILPEECQDTAKFLLLFDKLFDSFNGHTYSGTAKELRGCLKNTSPHIKFWKEMLPILKSIEFKNNKSTDGTEKIKYVKVPSTVNWASNIDSFIEMWEILKNNYGINNLLPRNFNQDPLENFFSGIRSNGVRNTNPTCTQFVNAYKTLLVNNLCSPHSIHSNCESDNNKCLQSLTHLLKYKKQCVSQNENISFNIDTYIQNLRNINCDEDEQINIIYQESKRYVAGYIINKCQKKVFKSCGICKNIFFNDVRDPATYTYFRDYTKKSLTYCKEDFLKITKRIYKIIIFCLRDSPQESNLKEKMEYLINIDVNFEFIICETHKSLLVKCIVQTAINIIVHSWCKGVNNILKGQIDQFDQNDTVKVQARTYYLKRLKK